MKQGTYKQEFISEVTVLGRALTKTFLHMPLMGANPFICAQHAPIIGKTYKNTRMQKVSKLKKLGKKRNK